MTLKKSSELKTMADLLASAGHKIVGFSSGQKIRARVLAKNYKSLILDIGGKGEGIVAEKAFVEARDFIKDLNVGDEILASVLIPETKEGYTLLSLRHAVADSSWEKLEKFKKDSQAVAVVGRSSNPSGITVEAEGIIGFIPTSQLGSEIAKNPQNYIGKYFKAIPIEVDRPTDKLILSEKEVSEEESIKASKKAMEKIKEREIYSGIVTTVASFGCFVKINLEKASVEGLVHVSEFSWGKVQVPSEFVKEGDKVNVKVIGIRDGRLGLSIKQAGEDPWSKADKKYKKDSKVKGKVTKVSDFGAFVELEPGIEGLIHLTKIPPGTRLIEDQEVSCYIEEVDTKAKKLALGLVLTSKPVGYK